MTDAPPGPDAVEVPRTPWTRGLGHNAIALSLSAAFLDRLPPAALATGGPVLGIVGVAIAGLAAFAFLYLAPASRAFRWRRPFAGISASTFGERGALVVPGLLLIVAHVV